MITNTHRFPDVNKGTLHMINISMFGGLYQTLQFYETHTSEYSFREAVSAPMIGRLLSLGVEREEATDILKQAFELGDKMISESSKGI